MSRETIRTMAEAMLAGFVNPPTTVFWWDETGYIEYRVVNRRFMEPSAPRDA